MVARSFARAGRKAVIVWQPDPDQSRDRVRSGLGCPAPRPAVSKDLEANRGGTMGCCGFGADFRLRKPAEFAIVLHRGEVLTSTHFLVKRRANGLHHPRLGLIVGKRNLKLAVARNRLKRCIREMVRLNQGELVGMDLVFRLRAPVAVGGYATLRREVVELVERLSS